MMNVSKKIITKECELQVGGITKKFSKKMYTKKGLYSSNFKEVSATSDRYNITEHKAILRQRLTWCFYLLKNLDSV
jgi:hypothetical protein